MVRRCALHYLILLLVVLVPGFARAWEETQIHGRPYVSVESMKKAYGFDSLKRSGKAITLENSKVRIQMSSGSQECQMNGVKFVFSYPVAISGGRPWVSKIDLTKLVNPVLRPNFIGSAGNFQTVILDPGHGGKDSGATNSLGTEARYNLAVARHIKSILETQFKYRVVMTRESDVFLSLQQRVDVANRVTGNAIFISIHHNSGQRLARGIETFTLSPVGVSHYGRGLKASDFSPKTGNHHDSANVALATAIHGSMLRLINKDKAYTLDRGIKRARFSVLSGVKHPSVLVECGFMSNNFEARLINSPGYQKTVAQSIALAVNQYRYAVAQKKRK